MTDLASTAAQHFRNRRVLAAKAVAAQRWTKDRAEAELLPWLAIAAAAGADLPELRDQRTVIFPYASSGQVQTVRLGADDICPPDRWQGALARARDAALDRASDEASTRHARELAALCAGLSITIPFQPRQPAAQQQEAA